MTEDQRVGVKRVSKFLSSQVIAYFAKAALVVGCLMLAAWVAPYLPSVLVPIFILAYAVVATMGALYHTVIYRMHKQKKLTADGVLAKLNRKWTTWLIGYLALFSVSGFFFLLSAPAWDGFEWLLTWLAIPVYYVAFLVLRQRLKKEYAAEYYKAHAMLWSFWIAGAILCLAYALFTTLSNVHGEYGTLRQAFQSVVDPYEHAPSALMAEASYLSSFTDGLTSFAFAQAERSSFMLGLLCQFAIYALALFGLMNQFGFCLLSPDEVKSEFRILPVDDDDEGEQKRVRKRYASVVVSALIMLYAIFLALEFETAKLHASGEVTAVRSFIEEQRERLVLLVDELPEREQQREAVEEEVEAIKQRRLEELTPLINDYYDGCMSNIDSYLDWYYGPFGRIAKLFGNVDDAAKTFKERVTAGVDDGVLAESYQEFQTQLNDAKSRWYSTYLEDLPESLQADVESAQEELKLDEAVDLWPSLGDAKDNAELKRILLSEGEDESREFMEARLAGYIDQVRASTLALLQ